MRVKPIAHPLTGEHVLGVHPTMTPDVKTGWNRRLNLYTGRSLSDSSLKTEQQVRAGRLALRGQMVSPGVVSGLEVGVEAGDGTEGESGKKLEGIFYHLAPGFGLTASGEDVVLSRTLRVAVRDVPVYAPVRMLDAPPQPPAGEGEDEGEDEGEGVGEGDVTTPEEFVPIELEVATERRRVPFAEFTGVPVRERESAPGRLKVLPSRAGAHLEVRRVGRTLGELIDEGVDELPRVGVLVLQPIVAEMVGQYDDEDPCEEDPENYAFEDWQLADGFRLVYYAWPAEWEPLPAPGGRWRNRIAYAVFNAERRHGPSEPLPWEDVGVPVALVAFDEEWGFRFVDCHTVVRAGGKPKRRTPLLGEAGNPFLWQSRVRQLAEHLGDEELDGLSADELAREFRYLPPVGMMPAGVVDFLTGVTSLNHDRRVRGSRFFPASYHITVAPVPLEQLDIAVEAAAALKPFDLFTRDQVEILVPVPETLYDPNLLVVEKVDEEFQASIDEFNARADEWLQRRGDLRRKLKLLVRGTTGKEPTYSDPDPDATTPFAPAEEPYGTGSAGADRFVEAIKILKGRLDGETPLTAGQLDKLDALGLEGFTDFLEDLIEQANDRVDFGFLRVRTDIYRIRQLFVDNVAATRLATSPTLAGIAQGVTANATNQDIETYLRDAKNSVPGRTKAPATGGPASAGGSAGQPSAAGGGTTGNSLVLGTQTFNMMSGSMAAGLAPLAGFMEGAANLAAFNLAAMTFQQPVEFKLPTTTAGQLVAHASAGRLSGVLNPSTPVKVDVRDQVSIAGESLDFRTVSIAERLEMPKAPEAKNFSVATRYEVVNGLAQIGLNLDGIEIPAVTVYDANKRPVINEATKQPVRETKRFGDIKGDLGGSLLKDEHPQDADEAAFFSSGVAVLDAAVSTLRQVEGLIKQYRVALELTRQTLATVRKLTAKAERRLAVVEAELAEARHDVAVARALLAEETERVGGVNRRRDEIVNEHVRFLAYQRPRHQDLNADAPARALDPGFTEEPVPACLASDVDVPAELRAMVALLREAPLKWLTGVRPLLDRLDRLESLREVVVHAKTRALSVEPAPLTLRASASAGGRLAEAIGKVYAAQRTVVATRRTQTAQLDLGLFAGQGWQLTRDRAADSVSLGDLIESGHGRSDVALAAGRELDNVARVAACLYLKFGDVLPAVRLEWVELLSQYDAAVSLRNLAALPRWAEVEYLDRREAQTLVDWLYQRVDPREAEAVAIASDLVRVCLLVASHAPVKRVIAGHVPRATVVKTGGRVELAVDHTKVRLGMHALFFDAANTLVARGVVEDLNAGQAAARVVHAPGESVSLEAGARVQFTDSGVLPTTTTKNASKAVRGS